MQHDQHVQAYHHREAVAAERERRRLSDSHDGRWGTAVAIQNLTRTRDNHRRALRGPVQVHPIN